MLRGGTAATGGEIGRRPESAFPNHSVSHCQFPLDRLSASSCSKAHGQAITKNDPEDRRSSGPGNACHLRRIRLVIVWHLERDRSQWPALRRKGHAEDLSGGGARWVAGWFE